MKFNQRIIAAAVLFSNYCLSQTPILNSFPTATNSVIYLDFDGQIVTGTQWNTSSGVATINALASTQSAANKRKIWARVSEDYRPFNVNVTTDENKFNNAPSNRRIRLVITPTNAWYGNSAGGVAYLNSFTWGGTPGTPAWIFEAMLSNNEKNIGEACSHECGHSLSLQHQSVYNATCSQTAQYNPGQGSGVTSWAPIMGVGYSKNITVWNNGPCALGCTNYQLDHGNGSQGLTKSNMLTFRTDDIGDTYATGQPIILSSPTVIDSGYITKPADKDVFTFTLSNITQISFQCKPWAFDTTTYSGANLDIRFKLFTAGGTLLAADSTLSRLNTRLGTVLNPGAYYFEIDGGLSANYSDYGSLGTFYVTVKSTSITGIVSNFSVPAGICSGNSFVLTDASFGNPTSWAWNMPGAIPPTSTQNNPTVTYATGGVYSVTLSATSGAISSTPVVKQITVTTTPTVIVSATPSTVCEGESTTLSASGASNYNWETGSTSLSLLVTPMVTTSYSVTGFNSSCSGTAAIMVVVDPCTGINALTSDKTRLEIYPNPASTFFTIKSEIGNGKIEISNMLGGRIYSGILDNNTKEINVEKWAKGLYIVNYNKNGVNVTRKLILQ